MTASSREDESPVGEESRDPPLLFPLPLTPFEHYYWCDNRPEYPTTFTIELLLEGTPRRELLELALDDALRRHPLLTARVREPLRGRPEWIEAVSSQQRITWHEQMHTRTARPAQYIDLSVASGLRVAACGAAGQCTLELHFHHAACDALGALRFIEDWLILYHGRVSGNSVTTLLPPVDAERLRWRGDFGLTEANYKPNLADAWRTVRLWGKLLMRAPGVLAAPANAPMPASVEADTELHSCSLDAATWRGLRQVAASAQATVNDVLLRDLFLVMRDWQAAHGGERRPLRVTMPTALRNKEDRTMPAANLLGFAFLTRPWQDCEQGDALLNSVRDETLHVKRSRLGLYFLGGLAFASQRPRMLKWHLDRDRPLATAVLSNVGRVFARSPLRARDGRLHSGDLRLLRIRGAPPVRPGTRASLAAVRYADETWISLRVDRRTLAAPSAERLLAAYAERLRHTATASA